MCLRHCRNDVYGPELDRYQPIFDTIQVSIMRISLMSTIILFQYHSGLYTMQGKIALSINMVLT